MRVSDIFILSGGILGGDDRGLEDYDDGGYLFNCFGSRQCYGRRYDRFDGEFNGGLRNQSFTHGRGYDLVTG